MTAMPDFNSKELEPLIDSALNGCCFFLGAGFSKLVGFKSWDDLADKVTDIFWSERNEIKKENLKLTHSIKENLKKRKDKEVALDYLHRLNSELFCKNIEEIFLHDGEEPNLDPIELMKPLVLNTNNIIVQTNLDKSFQEHFGIKEEDISINPDFGKIPKKLSYLHGRIDKRDSWIFTQGQYIKYYLDDNSKLIIFLEGLFKERNVIFIGYGLRDHEILRIIAKARLNSPEGKKREHYAFTPTYTEENIEISVKESIYKEYYGINLVKYPIEETGYEILEDVLKNFVETVRRKESEKEKRTSINQV